MQNRTAKFDVDVGIGFFSDVRNYLNKCKFDGKKIEFIESSGWISRIFSIKGDLDDMILIKNQFDKWAEKLN